MGKWGQNFRTGAPRGPIRPIRSALTSENRNRSDPKPSHTRKVAGSKKIFDWNLAADQASILNAFQALDEYLEDMIARRRRTLTDDLISELIRGEDDGEKLDHDELLSLAVALLGTGTEPPVTNGRRRGPSLRLSRPMGALDQLELVPHAVGEAMRYRPIGFALPRIATEYLELAGVRIPA